eukprot:GHVU01089575.1.p1 GENE.GHVU01089575.1~~GHVU01089575.1.p1  ORF type:complete len:123 (-),score=26.45 GHVU01089575.1:22-390(-)
MMCYRMYYLSVCLLSTICLYVCLPCMSVCLATVGGCCCCCSLPVPPPVAAAPPPPPPPPLGHHPAARPSLFRYTAAVAAASQVRSERDSLRAEVARLRDEAEAERVETDRAMKAVMNERMKE